jgi:site-specific DNA recombinase
VRLAIYARYSSDQQNERSIDDQVRLCRDHAARLGGDVVGIYADYALSGDVLRNRPQAIRLLTDARAGSCDAVLAESLDRLSRDQEDIAGIFKRLRFAGVRLLTVSEGEIGELHIGLKGTMNALFLRDLAAKIRRGQRGRAADGLIPGGLSYGYEVVRQLDAKGELIRGRRRIKEDEAAAIRRIFEEYASGRSSRMIAAGLNRDAIPSPRGGQWGASAINGGRARASGILYNEAYVGKLVYNRTTFSKDPETGRRISRALPVGERVTATVESLRIISDDLWQAVQNRKARYAAMPIHKCRRPRHLFSGLIFCGDCGGAYTIKSGDQLACSAHREKSTCDNGRTIRVPEIERRVFDGLRRRLLAPESIAQLVIEYSAERARLHELDKRTRGNIAKRVAQAKQRIERLVDAIAAGTATRATCERLIAEEAECARMEQELWHLEARARSVIELHPRAISRYQERVAALTEALRGENPEREAAIAILRSLVDRIDVTPLPARGQVALTAYGLIAGLVDYATRKQAVNDSTVMVVAGEGLEPPTLGYDSPAKP